MDITPLVPTAFKVIQRYGEGQFIINKETFSGTILLTPQQVTPLPYRSWDDIAWDVLPIPSSIELLLIGSGASLQPLPPALRQQFRTHRLAVDSMDTGAACRTYNILLSEGRNIAALLLPVY